MHVIKELHCIETRNCSKLECKAEANTANPEQTERAVG